MPYFIGEIIAWDNTASVPEHWQICDGTNGTPDLRNSFVKGGNPLNLPAIRTSGGSSEHTHSYASNSGLSPAHNHTRTSGTVGSGGGDDTAYAGTGSTTSPGSHGHTISYSISNNTLFHEHTIGTTGSATSLPSHISLLFIMKYE